MVGKDLVRPECVLCTSDGALYTADWRGGVCRTAPNGEQSLFLANDGSPHLAPNGIALLADGSFLLADLGETGGVWRLHRDGQLEPFLTELNGQPMPPCNFVMVDALERVWITVSTTRIPRALGYRKDVADGYVVLFDGAGARVVADGLGYTNEAQFDPQMEWLYVNETFARCLSRFRVKRDGRLGEKQVVHHFGHGVFPDGLAFDEEGGIWIVSIISNRVIRVGPDGRVETIVEDSDRAHLDWVEQAFQNDSMGREHLDNVKSRRLQNISSIAFGGSGRTTAYLGCLLGDQLACFDLPVRGAQPVHWNWNY